MKPDGSESEEKTSNYAYNSMKTKKKAIKRQYGVTGYLPSILQRCAIVPPSIMALIISAAMLSKRSAPLAAQSPTLSPTLESNHNHYDTTGSRGLGG